MPADPPIGYVDEMLERLSTDSRAPSLLTTSAFLAVTTLLAHPVPGSPLAAQEERTFRAVRPLGPGNELTAAVSLGDVNGDGALDVVVANGRHWAEQNRIYLNDGRAAFTLARRLGEEEDGTYAVPLADFDGDGDLDIAVGNDRTRNLVFLNDGTGRFEAGATFGTPSSTRSLTLADLDGDGHPDIVTANIGEVNAVYFGDSAGGFARSLPFGSDDDLSYAVRLADVDLDGDVDIIVANTGGRNAVYFNRGGEVAGFDEFRFGCEDCDTYGLAVGDLNGDGFPEIVTANSGAQNGIFANVGVGRE